jgi:hypothetical protein
MEEFKPRTLAHLDYKMDPEVLKLTQIDWDVFLKLLKIIQKSIWFATF